MQRIKLDIYRSNNNVLEFWIHLIDATLCLNTEASVIKKNDRSHALQVTR